MAALHFKLDVLAPSLALALRAIGCADVRFGILPSQSRFRGDDVLTKACALRTRQNVT